jgi:hypothetical protein
MKIRLAWFLACASLLGAEEFDVVVAGGTPGGLAAAVSAARLGRSVALVEYHRHLGGMSASGLGKSDLETKEIIGGVFREFTQRVLRYYVTKYGPQSENVKLCRDGYYYEPSVAEQVFGEMIAEQKGVRVLRGHRIREVSRSGTRVVAMRVEDRSTGVSLELRGKVFIDATYEGDLAAFAGAAYRVGRESRSDFNELHAGVVYQDYETRTFLSGTTGEGDQRLQAYTYRLCLTTDAKNSRALTDPPPDYDRTRYVGYLDDWKAGRMDATKDAKPGRGYYAPTFGTVVRALSMADLPNRKVDVNMNPRPLGFPFAELNYGYAEADWDAREKIDRHIRNVTLGLLYFLQNDAEIPEEHRKLARGFQLPKDESTDTGNFPWQLYVREARRIIGEYTFSESDLITGPERRRAKVHAGSVAAGDFPVDSFPVRRRERKDQKALEGYILMLDEFTQPYQIPYGTMVPRDVDGLLVPVALSSTHVAFSTIRMEPTWMALGQAAGTAAHLAIQTGKQPRAIDVNSLQRLLLKNGQVLTFFRDMDTRSPQHAAMQYFGTKGFFTGYEADAAAPVDAGVARQWVELIKEQLPGKELPAWRGAAPLRWDDLRSWTGTAQAASAEGTVTRGELCRVLYELLEAK